MSILDHGHSQKISKIETLRLAQNYIKLLALFLTTNKRYKFEDLHQVLSKNLSQTTGNLLRARLMYDLDYSIAASIIEDSEEGPTEDFDSYSEYLDVDPFYSCCYK